MKSLISALVLAVLASACSHPLNIVGEGDILSASGNRTCTLEQYQQGNPKCKLNLVYGTYGETYYAQARSDWHFHRWAGCFSSPAAGECRFDMPASTVQNFVGTTAPPLWAIFRPDTITGYNSLFMGHSLFHPFAAGLPAHASQAGFVDHEQQDFLFGSYTGAPLVVWHTPQNRVQVQNVLNQGDVDLFGMTYHPDVPGIEGYRLWVQYALQKNPDTRFFIGLPWQWYADQTTAANYEASWHAYHPATIHPLIDTLRAEFPGVDFFCVPYGQSAVELYKLFDEGNLPDVEALVSTTVPAVFTDSRGHPNAILEALGELVWLNAIYGVDLTTYGFDPGYQADLKAIAQAIAAGHDPAYNAPYQ